MEQIETVKLKCNVCNKTFGSENALENHSASKKHLRADIKSSDIKSSKQTEMKETLKSVEINKETVTIKSVSVEWKKKMAEATTEAEIQDLIDLKMKTATDLLKETDCLFCRTSSKSFEANLKHMAAKHSFFIPDLEYLVDLKGLVKYLADKICIANVCIYCNGKGRTMYSTEAVQSHMVSKGHCKIAYEDEGDCDDISLFYDFSAMYSSSDNEEATEDEWEVAEWSDDDESLEVVDLVQVDMIIDDQSIINKKKKKKMEPSELEDDGFQLVLPSGARLGNRNYKLFWNQRLAGTEIVPGSRNDPSMKLRMASHYKTLGFSNPRDFSKSLMVNEKQRLAAKATRKETRLAMHKEYDFKTITGFKANRQKFFVDRNGYATG